MTFVAFPRARNLSVLSALGESARRVRARHSLTEQERHNMRVSRNQAAVYTTSLGSHLHYR